MQHPIRLLVNYWEISPAALGSRLDELLHAGVTQIATFVPWQALESDISHMLPRLLQAVVERNMTLSLIVTPEVGVHYANSGLPKDLASRPEVQALHSQRGAVGAHLPPNGFSLPSLVSPDF